MDRLWRATKAGHACRPTYSKCSRQHQRPKACYTDGSRRFTWLQHSKLQVQILRPYLDCEGPLILPCACPTPTQATWTSILQRRRKFTSGRCIAGWIPCRTIAGGIIVMVCRSTSLRSELMTRHVAAAYARCTKPYRHIICVHQGPKLHRSGHQRCK
ncbi:hypothetical protein BD779DRAFT_817921 [Infundibulicybe gibba]|nr:hypothetical protein BD779DRAFT_817921 [Infundibulicybe gibba]